VRMSQSLSHCKRSAASRSSFPAQAADAKGRLRARLLQVLVKDGGEWKIATYHNVDVKEGVAVPEPR
ncbi:MAG TPA: hypothetical protein VEU75_00285, partial [Candidatus Acidoferrum sp.]|nr:hypothetical protein [Candidatus Acidoferrum sp.]